MIIEIIIRTLKKETEVVVNQEQNCVSLNGEMINYKTDEFIKELLNIVSSWQPQLINDRVVDGESYIVKIKDNLNEKIFKGRNKFPKNYSEFKKLIKQLEKNS